MDYVVLLLPYGFRRKQALLYRTTGCECTARVGGERSVGLERHGKDMLLVPS
jgi:hypothetical protein